MVVADFGCGEAKIAQILRDVTVHSFDLVALNEHVTACDMKKVLPLNPITHYGDSLNTSALR